ncbi:histidinol-phosphatase HisJ family protein [Clostridium sp. 'White wine YQ']|uniref:histidinol-phosphatase HisJ family protein n=1 Tax=Clostridium sp. 'White wine YQ' TaxID=3027474 RepID=UPI00236670C7|nr:histidinol-phosphatase HisJ family protein [Clostridium sp. 'White wine YQ']MDD7793717.1 histidinol-phosphatase HisJ family protein [Clostridium sp. 'White wine YQ']
MICDYHVHTNFSDDSEYIMESVITDAIKMGISEICFTDHVDYGIKVDWEQSDMIKHDENTPIYNVNYPLYFKEIERLQIKYSNEIRIKKGLEFGVQMHTIKSFQKIFNLYPMDFVILSIHQINNKEFWTNEFQKGKTEKEYYYEYYQAMYDIIQNYHDYSVIGHMDLIRRYDNKDGFPFTNNEVMIREILKYIIKDGKGIEINTSSHRYKLNDLTPSRNILKIYKELGGKIITIGSDSHVHEDLGVYINETRLELKKLGFEYYCTFEDMKPIYHKL